MENYNNNIFSQDDKDIAYYYKVNSYVATPEGTLKEYDVKTKKVSTISSDMPSDPKDPARKNLNDPVVDTDRIVEELEKIRNTITSVISNIFK